MLLPTNLLAVTLALAPLMVTAAIFPSDTVVKMLDSKSFKKAMKQNQTTAVAFVAPWCGHCQHMAPEYSRAALGLHPLVPFYAVDCDKDSNKRLCAEQGVQGFPTIKLFPRGKQVAPITYDLPQRTASAFFYWATRQIPHGNKKLYHIEDIQPWIDDNVDRTRVLLVTKQKKVPLLWHVLGNKYKDKLLFASNRDRKGKSSVALGFEAGPKAESKVLVYLPGETKPIRYQGKNKLDTLSAFFDTVIADPASLVTANEPPVTEEEQPSEEELEIARKQEAQRIALAHGGFADLVDFEKALKEGHGAAFHGEGSDMDEMYHILKHAEEKEHEEKASEFIVPTPPPTAVLSQAPAEEAGRPSDEL